MASDRFVTPWGVPYEALSMRFSRQEYWSGLPFPSPGDLPDPGMDPLLHCWQASLYHWATWEALADGLLSILTFVSGVSQLPFEQSPDMTLKSCQIIPTFVSSCHWHL